MEALRVFFRGTPSDFSFKVFGRIHIMFLLVALLGCLYLIKNKEDLKEDKRFRNLIVYTLLLQQVVLYLWYGLSGYFSLQESLPLYNCRLAIISIIIGEVFKKEKIKYIGIYWGLMGSVLALLVPVLDPFGYDHYTFYSFFIGHLFLLWGSLYMVIVEEKPINRRILFRICNFTNAYHIMVTLFNRRINANYCFLIESPVMQDLISNLPKGIYSLIVLFIFDLIMFITHLALSKIVDYTLGDEVEYIKEY